MQPPLVGAEALLADAAAGAPVSGIRKADPELRCAAQRAAWEPAGARKLPEGARSTTHLHHCTTQLFSRAF